MVLAYVLLYQQLELLMTHSRIPSSEGYRKRMKTERLAKYGRITINVLISIFISTELVLMILSLVGAILIPTFYTILYISFIIVLVGVNLNQVLIYCKLVGSPYKN